MQGAADDDGSQPVTTVDGEGATGLDLVEVFCDATDIARKYQQGETEVTIPRNTYIAMLKTRGSADNLRTHYQRRERFRAVRGTRLYA